MDMIEQITEERFLEASSAPIWLIKGFAKIEKLFQQAYEGRYFFELIQNVRDANINNPEGGKIFVSFTNQCLAVSNTGEPFNEAGIRSIITIADSEKQNQDLIGFKGIGFKSILEITNAPRVITKGGTIIFDKELTIKKFVSRPSKLSEIPLFAFPHFDTRRLTKEEIETGIVTRIELPLKAGITSERIITDFKKIGPYQLLLLGHLDSIQFSVDGTELCYQFKKDAARQALTLTTEAHIFHFRIFSPTKRFVVSKSLIDSLDEEEAKIVSDPRGIDFTLALELNDKNNYVPINDAKLYLFYPIDLVTGFSFLIHSYFLVNPGRTGLRNNNFNSELLIEIGNFIGSEWLSQLKKHHRNQTTKILQFERTNEILKPLYDAVVKTLSTAAFIFDQRTNKFFKPADVIIGDIEDKAVFLDGKYGDKYIIFCKDNTLRDWLVDEFNIPYLSLDLIRDTVEEICRVQLKKRNYVFFQKLYQYIIQVGADFSGKKILLTSFNTLVSDENKVFYAGKKLNISVPKTLKKEINFLHPSIRIKDFREGKSAIGVIEYSTFELVRRICSLFSQDPEVNAEIYSILMQITEWDVKSEREIKLSCLVPVKGNGWLNPLYQPVYFESVELLELYPSGNFIDLSNFEKILGGQKGINRLLEIVTVWRIPAIFLNVDETKCNIPGYQLKLATKMRVKTVYNSYYNIRFLDFPTNPNKWFSDQILQHWETYLSYITDENVPEVRVLTNDKRKDVPRSEYILISNFRDQLLNNDWVFTLQNEGPLSVNEVIAMEPEESRKPHMRILLSYVPIILSPFQSSGDLIRILNIAHLDGDSYENYKVIFEQAYNLNKTKQINKPFIDFYHKLFGKLSDFHLYRSSDPQSIQSVFKNTSLLCINEVDQHFYWDLAENIYHIEETITYSRLPKSIQKHLQPQFTLKNKNTFGRISKLIGKDSTRLLRSTFISEGKEKTLPLTEYYKHLPEVLALLEAHLAEPLVKRLAPVKETFVVISSSLQAKYSFENDEFVIIPVNYYVDQDHNRIYIKNMTSMEPNTNRVISDALNEFFIKLLERDTQKFNLKLADYMGRNESEKSLFLQQYEIDSASVTEFREMLMNIPFSPRIAFWQAVLHAKKLNIVLDGEDFTEYLTKILNLSIEQIEHFEQTFDFTRQNTDANIEPLHELLLVLNLTLQDLNTNLTPPVSFATYHRIAFERIHNQFRKTFNEQVYEHLHSKGIKQKEEYQNLLDQYDFIQAPSYSHDSKRDYKGDLFDMLRLQFPFWMDSITPKKHFDDILNVYSSAKNVVLNSLMIGEDEFEDFLSYNKNRSLLYFGETDEVISRYKKISESVKKKQDNKKMNPVDELNQYFDPNEKEIIPRTITNVPGTTISSEPKPHSTNKRVSGKTENNEHVKDLIGLVAEKLVYEKLKKKYRDVVWVSKNAARAGVNPEGDDSYGYDIQYVDSRGLLMKVEVKGRSGNEKSFEITPYEVAVASSLKTQYSVIFVTNTLSNVQRKMEDFGNPFDFEIGENLFSNPRFSVEFKSVTIVFDVTADTTKYSVLSAVPEDKELQSV